MRKHSPCQVIFSPPYTLTTVLFSDSVPGPPHPPPSITWTDTWTGAPERQAWIDAAKSMRSPSCFLILSQLSSQTGNREYLVPLKIWIQPARTPGR